MIGDMSIEMNYNRKIKYEKIWLKWKLMSCKCGLLMLFLLHIHDTDTKLNHNEKLTHSQVKIGNSLKIEWTWTFSKSRLHRKFIQIRTEIIIQNRIAIENPLKNNFESKTHSKLRLNRNTQNRFKNRRSL